MNKYRVWSVCLLMLLILSGSLLRAVRAGREKDEVLFPKREYVKTVSAVFFKKVNLTLPQVEKVEFFARSQAYPSAYLALSPFLVKEPYFKTLFAQFETDNDGLIEEFRAIKGEIMMDNYKLYPAKLGVGRFKFFLAALYVLSHDFMNNTLSGDTAFRLWNVVLALTENALKEKTVPAENAAILRISARLSFFKAIKKWQKRSLKLMEKIKPETITDKDLRFVCGLDARM